MANYLKEAAGEIRKLTQSAQVTDAEMDDRISDIIDALDVAADAFEYLVERFREIAI